MTPVQLAGAALVLGGVMLVTLRPARYFLEIDSGPENSPARPRSYGGATRAWAGAFATSLRARRLRVTVVARERQALEKTAMKSAPPTGATVVTVAADITSEQGRIAALAACPAAGHPRHHAGGPARDFRKFSRRRLG